DAAPAPAEPPLLALPDPAAPPLVLPAAPASFPVPPVSPKGSCSSDPQRRLTTAHPRSTKRLIQVLISSTSEHPQHSLSVVPHSNASSRLVASEFRFPCETTPALEHRSACQSGDPEASGPPSG